MKVTGYVWVPVEVDVTVVEDGGFVEHAAIKAVQAVRDLGKGSIRSGLVHTEDGDYSFQVSYRDANHVDIHSIVHPDGFTWD